MLCEARLLRIVHTAKMMVDFVLPGGYGRAKPVCPEVGILVQLYD